MFSAKAENAYTGVLELTGRQYDWQVYSITGLNPPPAQINTATIAGMDGSKYNSGKLNNRNIVISLRLVGNVEANRQLLYSYFRTKEEITFYFQNQNRDVRISGYVVSVECDIFSIGEIMQISIMCPQPYFESVLEQVREISNELGAFHFPFSIEYGEPVPFSEIVSGRLTNIINGTDTPTGVVIKIDFEAAVQTIQIRNETLNEGLTLTYNFLPGDEVIVNTNFGQKRITLLRDGQAYNLFGSLQEGSVFLQLQPGNNVFGYAADSGAADLDTYITILFTDKYRGV